MMDHAAWTWLSEAQDREDSWTFHPADCLKRGCQWSLAELPTFFEEGWTLRHIDGRDGTVDEREVLTRCVSPALSIKQFLLDLIDEWHWNVNDRLDGPGDTELEAAWIDYIEGSPA